MVREEGTVRWWGRMGTMAQEVHLSRQGNPSVHPVSSTGVGKNNEKGN